MDQSNHLITLPRKEYDELISKVRTVETRLGKLQARHNSEVEKLHTQLQEAYKGVVIVHTNHPYFSRYKSVRYKLQKSSPELDQILEALVEDARKEDKNFEVECRLLKEIIGKAYYALTSKGLLPTRKARIETASKLMEDVPVG